MFKDNVARVVTTECDGYSNFPTYSVAVLIKHSRENVDYLSQLKKTVADFFEFRQYVEDHIKDQYLTSELEGTPIHEWAEYCLSLVDWDEVAKEHYEEGT
jgi:hypothetical protein